MRNITVPVKNVALLAAQGQALLSAPQRLTHRLGLIHGDTGLGKTTSTAWFAIRHNAYYVRAMAAWRTPSALLRAICRELEIPPRRFMDIMLDDITRKLSMEERPLFIDEADYLVRFPDMRDSIMDLQDMSTMPIILVGMKDIKREIKKSEKFDNRFLIDVEFLPLDEHDARLITEHLCEVSVSDCLLADLNKYAKGNTRRITTGLYRIEQVAASLGVKAMDLAAFREAKGTYFLGVSA
ncbi:ATP-binding protein [uncultured Endozoicomonas sp.]|uniref:AAA family ATPase n=1 Tax=uncultured Endozoicomonas sp. TaxID=432652 RepID=UPI002631929F|nr:ATP-binding protein [uncultured Endozoicomonas sp.]